MPPKKALTVFVLVVSLLLLTIATAPIMAQDVVEPGQFEEADCPMMLPGELNITCGYLSVPEVHGDANSRMIKLAVAILHSPSDQPQPDPVVHLHGGPGQRDLERSFDWLNSPYLAERDLILVGSARRGFLRTGAGLPRGGSGDGEQPDPGTEHG
ncbi:MAG: hypothetical protein K8J31_16120 [Anaerolineae bacterium]|nr:hypothetical protein [Anaerolineae bacterium]